MASTYLTRTMSGNSNQKVFTLSVWLKRNGLGRQVIMGVGGSGNYAMELYFTSGNQIDWWNYFNGAYAGRKVTNRVFRDTNGWLHIVARWDTTDSTAANRMRLYVNGVEETSFSTDSDPNLNQTSEWNSGSVHEIGRNGNSSYCFDGAMSHIHFVDGSALAPTVFGETDATTGEWKIKTSPSFTPGSNGFTILKDGNTVTDQSANSNDFSVAAGTLTKTEDCPSNVFATFNPLLPDAQTLSNGNNTFTNDGGANWRVTGSTLGASSGKYYCEIKITELGGGSQVGIMNLNQLPASLATDLGSAAWSWSYYHTGSKRHSNSTTSYGASYTTGDIIGIAMDLDNNKLYFHKNGTYQDSGDPTSGSTGTGSAFDLDAGGVYAFAASSNDSGTNPIQDANFGNGFFGTTAVSSAGTNASGNGIFEYDVPAGYTALSTKGLNL